MSSLTDTRQGPRRLSRRRFLRHLAGGAAGTLALTMLGGCGVAGAGATGKGDQDKAGFTNAVAAQQITVSAHPAGLLQWDREGYQALAGDVTFVVNNPSPLAHQFGVEGHGVNAQSANINAGATNTYTLRGLQAGEYLIVCNFPGHREAGMVAKLLVI